MPVSEAPPEVIRGKPAATSLAERYRRVRDQSLLLAAPLTAEDCCVQSMPDASPTKWHLGHTTWFFETFVLARGEPGYAAFQPLFRELFNSYYHSAGPRHPRPQRGLLTRPSLDAVLDYRRAVDERMQHLLLRHDLAPDLLGLVILGLHHEQQHQELLLTDIKHLFAQNPLLPVYRGAKETPTRFPLPPLTWCEFAGGLVDIGCDRAAGRSIGGFCFDNEGPRHCYHLAPYRLASRLVTNGEYAQFIAAGGYAEPLLWLSDGWDWVQAAQRTHPLYWREGEGAWQEFTLGGLLPLNPDLPALHLSYYEADAYARWAGARLPSEQEWEAAAAALPLQGHFADSGRFHPLPANAVGIGGGLLQLYGDAWEWTRSAYSPYPGFRPADDGTAEYNGKFMVNQYVLRGGSCATPADHMRPSYRNFFAPGATWQFSGIRLAQDGPAE